MGKALREATGFRTHLLFWIPVLSLYVGSADDLSFQPCDSFKMYVCILLRSLSCFQWRGDRWREASTLFILAKEVLLQTTNLEVTCRISVRNQGGWRQEDDRFISCRSSLAG